MEELIRIQRATVDEHIREENVHNWPAVYGTFVQDEGFAFYDVVALHAHFAGLTGVKDFCSGLLVSEIVVGVWLSVRCCGRAQQSYGGGMCFSSHPAIIGERGFYCSDGVEIGLFLGGLACLRQDLADLLWRVAVHPRNRALHRCCKLSRKLWLCVEPVLSCAQDKERNFLKPQRRFCRRGGSRINEHQKRGVPSLEVTQAKRADQAYVNDAALHR